MLAAFPHQVWHKTPASCTLPRDMLSKPIAVGLCSSTRRQIFADGRWNSLQGLDGLGETCVVDEKDLSLPFDYAFKDSEGSPVLTSALGLVDVANDHFAFLSLPEQEQLGARPKTAAKGDAGLESRVQSLEVTLGTMAENLAKITKSMEQPAPRVSAMKPPGPRSSSPPRVTFPDLDPTMVASARAAGIEEEALQQMQRMMATTTTSRRWTSHSCRESPRFRWQLPQVRECLRWRTSKLNQKILAWTRNLHRLPFGMLCPSSRRL